MTSGSFEDNNIIPKIKQSDKSKYITPNVKYWELPPLGRGFCSYFDALKFELFMAGPKNLMNTNMVSFDLNLRYRKNFQPLLRSPFLNFLFQ